MMAIDLVNRTDRTLGGLIGEEDRVAEQCAGRRHVDDRGVLTRLSKGSAYL